MISNRKYLSEMVFGKPVIYRAWTVLGASVILFFIGLSCAQAQFTMGTTLYLGTSVTVGGTSWNSVTITEPVPPSMTYLTCTGAPCAEAGGVVTWYLGNLLAGQSAFVTFYGVITSCPTNLQTTHSTIYVGSPQTVISVNSVSYSIICNTDTPTITPTITMTPVPTSTFTPSPTATSTPTLTPCGYPGNTCTPTFTTVVQDVFYVSKNILVPSQGSVSIYVGYTYFPGDYSLRVYNTAGELIKTLAPPQNITGPVSAPYSWDGTNGSNEACASGVYILYLIEPLGQKQKKIILVR
jgi:hypothetical protein